MSKSLNRVLLIGNLGADPELRSTTAGGRVATLSLATGQQWIAADGTKHERTQWHRVIVWNGKDGAQLADLVEKFAKKGSRLFVSGSIEYRSWQDKDGQTRYATEIKANEIILIDRPHDAAKDSVKVTEATPKLTEDGDDDLPF